MGAAVTIELTKPSDARDIRESGSLAYAKNEIMRLRSELGYLAQQYGMQIMPADASDLILGYDDDDDFERIIAEICHIRACLRLNTQSSKRRSRYNLHDPETTTNTQSEIIHESKNDDSDSDSSGSTRSGRSSHTERISS